MILLNDNFTSLSNLLEHCGEVSRHLSFTHVNRRHGFRITPNLRNSLVRGIGCREAFMQLPLCLRALWLAETVIHAREMIVRLWLLRI